jgi:hypothetical protein
MIQHRAQSGRERELLLLFRITLFFEQRRKRIVEGLLDGFSRLLFRLMAAIIRAFLLAVTLCLL